MGLGSLLTSRRRERGVLLASGMADMMYGMQRTTKSLRFSVWVKVNTETGGWMGRFLKGCRVNLGSEFVSNQP